MAAERTYLDANAGVPPLAPVREAMLDAALVGSDRTVESCLQEVRRRLAPDEIMAMTDLPDTNVTMNSHVRLARIAATMGD